jgi:hypothetical protein
MTNSNVSVATSLPTFLIIGAGRSGTTALNYYLMQHPEVFMCPIKETNYFMLDGGPGLSGEELGFPWPGDEAWFRRYFERWQVPAFQAYAALFQHASDALAVGEVSPGYLYSPRAPHRIKHYLPDAKLITILRQPIDRAFSSFVQHQRSGIESSTDFLQVLREEERMIREKRGGPRHDLRTGLYYEQLKRYYDLFPREQIKIYLYDDFERDPTSVLQDIFRYIGVDDSFSPNVSVKYNASGIPKGKAFDRILRRTHGLKKIAKRTLPNAALSWLAGLQNRLQNRNLVRQALPAHMSRKLTKKYYEADILKTQELTQVDLSHWLR